MSHNADENNRFLHSWIDKIIIGDAFVVLPQIPNESIDFVVSDLPYNLQKYGSDPRDIDNLPFDKYAERLDELSRQLYRILKRGSYCCLMMGQDPKKIGALAEALTRAGFTLDLEPIIVREKSDYVHVLITACKGRQAIDVKATLGIKNGIWVLKKWYEHPLKYVHPCTWSPEIPEALIKIFTEEGDIVLDAFNGIGTTTDAAKRLNRHFVGIDLYDWKARAEDERRKAEAKIRQLIGRVPHD